MKILQVVLLTLSVPVGLLLICVLSAILANIPDYKYYRKIYCQLPSMTFVKNGDQVYANFNGWNPDFVWFVKRNDFQLTENHYIHSGSMTNYDPYTFYWWMKYKRWFKKNVDINSLKDFTV